MSDDSVVLDTLLGALRSRYRRQTLVFLDASESHSVHIDEVVEHLSVNSEIGDEERLAVVLHHVTLPTLADALLIEYDAETRTVHVEDDSRLESALTLLEELQE